MKKKGLLGAVLSALFVIIYYGGLLLLFAFQPEIPSWARILLCLIPLGVCAVVILVLVQRIRELKSGETDDLDNY
jgi:ABC-type transport system involved in multi-copper enzyme maturation permease subunit